MIVRVCCVLWWEVTGPPSLLACVCRSEATIVESDETPKLVEFVG